MSARETKPPGEKAPRRESAPSRGLRWSRTDRALTGFLVLIWVVLISAGLIARTEPSWLRHLAGEGREVEARGAKSVGDAYLRQGHYEEAIRRYEIALGIQPDYVGALVNLAIAYGRTGRAERGEEILRSALESGSSQPGVISYNLGDLLERQGSIQEAIPYYQDALQTSVRPDRVWGKLAGAYLATGEDQSALESLEKALAVQLDPCTSYRRMLRRSLDTHTEFPASIEAIEAELQAGISVEDLAPYDLEIITRTQANSPDVAITHYRLGALYARRGDTALALERLRRALAIAPDFPEARELLREQEKAAGRD